MASRRLIPFRVCVIDYDCGAHGLEEDGTVLGYWNGATDSMGKMTLINIRNPQQPLYLFWDEVSRVRRPQIGYVP